MAGRNELADDSCWCRGALQYGVPPACTLERLTMRFESVGRQRPDIRTAKSIGDYSFRWFGRRFLDVDHRKGGDPVPPWCARSWPDQ